MKTASVNEMGCTHTQWCSGAFCLASGSNSEVDSGVVKCGTVILCEAQALT